MLILTCKSCRSIDYTEPFKLIDPLKLSWYCDKNYSQGAFVRLFQLCRAKHTGGDYDLLALQIDAVIKITKNIFDIYVFIFKFPKENGNLDLLQIWLTFRRKNSYLLAGMRRMMQKEICGRSFFLFLCFDGWILSRRVKIARFPTDILGRTFLLSDNMAENSMTSFWCLC